MDELGIGGMRVNCKETMYSSHLIGGNLNASKIEMRGGLPFKLTSKFAVRSLGGRFLPRLWFYGVRAVLISTSLLGQSSKYHTSHHCLSGLFWDVYASLLLGQIVNFLKLNKIIIVGIPRIEHCLLHTEETPKAGFE